MKAFTVYQPYAFAIAAGLKHYETRPRRTSIRGRVAVHAAIGGPDYISVALDSVLPESMELHYGAVIGGREPGRTAGIRRGDRDRGNRRLRTC